MSLLDNLSERSGRLSDDMSAYANDEINAGEMALRTAGETAGGLGDLAAPVIEAAIPPIVMEGIGWVVKGAVDSPLGKIAMKWMEDNPRAARNIMSGANAASLLPGGAMMKAGGAMRGYDKAATRGGTTATASNYVMNHYAPDRALTAAEKILRKPVELGVKGAQKMGKLKGMDVSNPEALDAAVLKTTALPNHIVKSIPEALRYQVDPSARALWGEQGISAAGQRHIGKEFAKQGKEYDGFKGPEKYTRGAEKSVAQGIYTGHIGTSRNRVGNKHPLQKEIEERSFLQGYTPLSEEGLAQTLNQFPGKMDVEHGVRGKLDSGSTQWDDMPDTPVSPETNAFASKYIMQKQNPKDAAKFVIKNPTSKMSGGHFNDVVYKNPANPALTDMFGKLADADGNVDLEQAFNFLEGNRNKYNAKIKKKSDGWMVVNTDMDHVRKNGLWLTGGKGGSAVTEGGVMWLTKLDPDGTMTNYMVDTHDFLEKGPTKGLMAAHLPTDVLATSPPMVSNIKNLRTVKRPDRQVNKKKIKGEKLEADTGYMAARGKGWKGSGAENMDPQGLLGQYMNVKPSKKALRGEQLRLAGKGATAGGLLYASED